MSYLYSNHFLKFGRGLTDAELQEAIEHVGGKNYDDFMKSYIFGTRPLPVADYLMKAGIIFKEKKPKGKNQGSLSVVLVPGKNVISQVLRGGTAWTYGLSAGDEIMAVGGKSGEHLQKKMNDLKSGDLIDVEILRGGEKMIISVEVLAPVVRDFEYEITDKMTPSQQIVFEKFLPIK
jgi:predicted metalloprotease with PDZ domain